MWWLRSGQRLCEAAVVSWKPSWFNLEVRASGLIVISSCHPPPKKLYGHLISYYDCGFMCPRQSVSRGFWLMTTNLKRSGVKLICFSNLYRSSWFKWERHFLCIFFYGWLITKTVIHIGRWYVDGVLKLQDFPKTWQTQHVMMKRLDLFFNFWAKKGRITLTKNR